MGNVSYARAFSAAQSQSHSCQGPWLGAGRGCLSAPSRSRSTILAFSISSTNSSSARSDDEYGWVCQYVYNHGRCASSVFLTVKSPTQPSILTSKAVHTRHVLETKQLVAVNKASDGIVDKSQSQLSITCGCHIEWSTYRARQVCAQWRKLPQYRCSLHPPTCEVLKSTSAPSGPHSHYMYYDVYIYCYSL